MKLIASQSLDIIRHSLGSISLEDLEEKEESENERKEYCSVISAVYPRLEKDMKKFLHEQLLFISNHAQNWEQVLFARGTYNGIDLLLEHWRKAHVESMAQGPDKVTNPHSPIGEV